jgi:hypothetical protein
MWDPVPGRVLLLLPICRRLTTSKMAAYNLREGCTVGMERQDNAHSPKSSSERRIRECQVCHIVRRNWNPESLSYMMQMERPRKKYRTLIGWGYLSLRCTSQYAAELPPLEVYVPKSIRTSCQVHPDVSGSA